MSWLAPLLVMYGPLLIVCVLCAAAQLFGRRTHKIRVPDPCKK